jgi:hypothetical protein
VLGIHIGVSVCKQEAVTGTEPKREHQSNRDTERRDGTGVGGGGGGGGRRGSGGGRGG